MRAKDFDQASERGFAVFRVLKLKAKLGGFIADKMTAPLAARTM
jgi:hypothetical protein